MLIAYLNADDKRAAHVSIKQRWEAICVLENGASSLVLSVRIAHLTLQGTVTRHRCCSVVVPLTIPALHALLSFGASSTAPLSATVICYHYPNFCPTQPQVLVHKPQEAPVPSLHYIVSPGLHLDP